ncbi:MAG: FAD-binding protein [Victivallaceae bacterium]|nr:FAD-binding protein [Victivallaceae bacterium]
MLTKKHHTVVLGSGAAGLAAALRLRAEGIDDVCIVTEGLTMGTSINTGSDKQTYYKLGICGRDLDSPYSLAESLRGSSAHGDIALVEAVNSVRAFSNLVNLGVPFPRDGYGQFAGYKTDHDPLRRATSCGPYTSRDMCRALIKEVKVRNIPVFENRIAVKLVTVSGRAAGLVAIHANADKNDMFEYYMAENVVFAVGGPGGLYDCSVYPVVHTGAIGLALQIGAEAASLPESQYGLASIKYRWNVSGTYMQVLPKFISTDADGSNPREFLREYFDNVGTMNSMVFLKGYQWPFDTRKIPDGSSIIDILVYEETAIRGRRVWLDFRDNPEGFDFASLSEEARTYLEKSGAAFGNPLERLLHMNPGAVELYKEHGIDLATEPLEIAVCSQHNNGGLSGNIWYESTNIGHLFPIGEVNGSHGVTRPGGSALNAGQVGAFRSAEYIAAKYAGRTLDETTAAAEAAKIVAAFEEQASRPAARSFREERAEFQSRMSTFGSHIRDRRKIEGAAKDAWNQYRRLVADGAAGKTVRETAEIFRNQQLCYAHAVYLDAIKFQMESGVGSRGSAMVVDPNGTAIHPKLGPEWRFQKEDASFREKQLITVAEKGSRWIPCRPIPESDDWFENVWADFRNKKIYEKR